MNFHNWPYHPAKLPEDATERRQFLDGLEEEFLAALRTNNKVHAFLNGYNISEAETERLLREHARKKRQLLEAAPRALEQMAEVPELRYREECNTCLEAIQQKKLFNLQLQWRAEQIQLPGIRIGLEFEVWGEKVLQCPLVPPVTEDELEWMLGFLETDEGGRWLVDPYVSWQDYRHLRDCEGADEEPWEEEYPAWYRYWDERAGTGLLLRLPDIRGEKEAHYRSAGWKADAAAREKELGPQPAPDPRPYFFYHDQNENQRLFFETFEDPFFNTLLRHERQQRKEWYDRIEDYDPVEDVRSLLALDEVPPMPAHADWREALQLCIARAVARRVREDLPQAYEEYRLFTETGLLPQRPRRRSRYGPEERLGHVAEEILRGRAALGEPRNLDF